MHHLVLTLFTLTVSKCVAMNFPPMAPFFFLCNYHGNIQEMGVERGEVALSVSVKGNPEFYVPGQYYEITVTSSMNFNGFFLTGLYTIADKAMGGLFSHQHVQGNQPVGQNLMCSLVHSHMNYLPTHQLSFIWIAPSAGMGCVTFLATANLQQQLLFKDTVVLQLCEEGDAKDKSLRPKLAELNSDLVILRDDFDSSNAFKTDLWNTVEGGEISDKCGVVLHGKSAVFCDAVGQRVMTTMPLNTTSAKILQFSISAGSCGNNVSRDHDIVILYSDTGCTQFTPIQNIRPPLTSDTEVHMIHLPLESRGEGICFQWLQLPLSAPSFLDSTTTTTTQQPTQSYTTQQPTQYATTQQPTQYITTQQPTTTKHTTTTRRSRITLQPFQIPTRAPADQPYYSRKTKTSGRKLLQDDSFSRDYDSCWAIDNIVIVNTANPPTVLEDDFDPVDPGNWLFFPGANIQPKCHSDNNAIYFNDDNQTYNYVVSRDVDLSPTNIQSDSILTEQFEYKTQSGWYIVGGHVDITCGEIEAGNSMVFDYDGKRLMCTPYIDTSVADNLRFYLGIGSGNCGGNGDVSEKAKIVIYLEDRDGQSQILDTLEPKRFRDPSLVSMKIPNRGNSRVCWIQKFHRGADFDAWAVDDVTVLPELPEQSSPNSHKMLQFKLNLHCGINIQDNSLQLEYSTNHGLDWSPLYTPCLPSTCHGTYLPYQSLFTSSQLSGWKRLTLPVPFQAQVPSVRFRWQQVQDSREPNWALDDVYIGECQTGCNGHGSCHQDGCDCDFGYHGPYCEESIVPNPTSLVENFENSLIVQSSQLLSIEGGEIGYNCGVISSGKALVFDKSGPRQVETTYLNTTEAVYLQFSIRVGSISMTSKCPPPSPSESIILEVSCTGGVYWKYLREFSSEHFKQPMMDSVQLPDFSKGESCKFRWRQLHHSGQGQGVWAIDDVSLSQEMTNMLLIDVSDMKDMREDLTAHLGKLVDSYCGAPKSITFAGKEKVNESRYLMTESLNVGPSQMIQFDITMGCGVPYSKNRDNQLYLEYSTDHGINWDLVYDACLPPAICETYKSGTVYHYSQYSHWTKVNIILPPDTWSPHTRFRWIQPEWGPNDAWAIRRFYIGQQCPDMCNGYGACEQGFCKCDQGYVDKNCQSASPMDSVIHADFGMRYEPEKDFVKITGGDIAKVGEGCGVIVSGESMYFYKDGVRELQTKDLNTTIDDFIQFYIRLGGNDRLCNGGDKRTESVLLQYSNNGGNTWSLLEEIHFTEYKRARFVYVELPETSKTTSTRFRWWQPEHSGEQADQWAIDEIYIGPHERLSQLHDDFDASPDPFDSGKWLMVTEGINSKYCQSDMPVMVLGNQFNDKYAITKDLQLNMGDVIQFRINVGCGHRFRWNYPVMFQYSQDNGMTWNLVQEPCYQQEDCDGDYTEGSLYYPGTHGEWTLIVIPVSSKIAQHPVLFRWWQPGDMTHSFALDDVYIGPSCDKYCHRRGVCLNQQCQCDQQSEDTNCQSDEGNPRGMLDRFDNRNQPTAYWNQITGGYLGRGCGVVDFANSLYFNGPGTREAKTDPLDTSSLRMIQFVIKIGGERNQNGCRQPQNRNEGIIVDYSVDNEISWNILKVIEPKVFNSTTQVVQVKLPKDSKTNHTIFRWWQPLGHGGMARAEWAIDSVLIGVNDSNTVGFQDNFNMMMPDPHTWFLADSAVPRITCNSKGNALEFSTNSGLRYAETWDYHVTPSTFLQFEIAMGCGSLYGTLYSVMLEYSVNMGKTWHPVVSECMPPNFECSGYHLSSEYSSDQHTNWTRVTVYLPPGAVSPATRFRWLQHTSHPRGTVWALDNVYLGEGCPWMCSGHGYCNERKCICDEGYSGDYCVPSVPLPMMLKDDFRSTEINRNNWREIYGGESTDICGHLVDGNSLTFHKNSLRMGVTKDIDTSMLNTIEFYFRYGCKGKESDWPRTHSVLLQYSSNGGITWKLLQELHYRNETGKRFFSINLPMTARMNSTRFRFWQPMNDGEMQTIWSIDNLFIGTMTNNPSLLQDDFDRDDADHDNWLFINGGEIAEYCQFNTLPSTNESGISSLVFRNTGKSEKSVVSRDLNIGPMSVLQFDINVGCGSQSTEKYPILLQYTSDGGKSWHLLVENCAEISESQCFDSKVPATIYYGGTSSSWRRVIVPVDNIHLCGSVRFRWYQGNIPEYDYGPEWAIDNVFIGMSCLSHCNGHGRCNEFMMCDCDEGYDGMFCEPVLPNPTYLKEDFGLPVPLSYPSRGDLPLGPLNDAPSDLDSKKWSIWSNVDVSTQCGIVFTGPSLYMNNKGERILQTKELNLVTVSSVEFYLQQGCDHPTNPASPIYLQYTTDGGIHWTSIEQFDFNIHGYKSKYIAIHLPPGARTASTQIRWWQPSVDGTFAETWSIDQIYIGGDIYRDQVLQDQPMVPEDSSWLMFPGGIVESVCDSQFLALHFKEKEKMRYAISADVSIKEGTYLQFYLAMGCQKQTQCFSIRVEFSFDMGKSWSLLQPACLPSNIDCSSYFTSTVYSSDIYYNWTRITIPIPYYVRSKSTRFRWLQPDDFNPSHTWGLSHLYIGNGCTQMCHGHGRCSNDSCICDEGWSGRTCNISTSQLPNILTDDFNIESTTNWIQIVGGDIVTPCYNLASGKVLHFTGGCNRILMTTDLDLHNSMFIQFYFMFGCNMPPLSRNESVLIDYSTNGGITWSPLLELYYNLYTSPSFISLTIPPSAKTTSTRVRWWQPQHQGPSLSDWLIDSVRINGEEINPKQFQTNKSDPLNPKDFTTFDHMSAGEYCNELNVIKGTVVNNERSTLVTREITLDKGYMLQFMINVGCDIPNNVTVSPVHLQYSTDHGIIWKYLMPQCLPNDPYCTSGVRMPTIYYSSPDYHWQRVILPLHGLPVSNGTRFRWIQPDDGQSIPSTWAIKDIYIGPACPNYCNGHGYCDYPYCICDAGYGREACQSILYENNPTYLKDTFDKVAINRSKWSMVQSGNIGIGCDILVEKTALVFNGTGLRQAVTVDLDLRNARFIQYTAMIGGEGQESGCFVPNSRDQSIILQFSIDGGITWKTLYTLDYLSYVQAREDYIDLPEQAKTASTRIRWWQPLATISNIDRPNWALDNVFIGGSEINPSVFQQSFNESQPQNDGGSYWQFSPYASVQNDICSRKDNVVSWEEGKGNRMFTTNQLIVQSGYMLQFKIVVGCNKVYNVCDDNEPVRLEFNKNPMSTSWHLVRTLCGPDSSNKMECRSQHQHDASIYSVSSHPSWTRITMKLPEKVYSSATRLRWRQESLQSKAPGWSLDDIYIGEACEDMCNGRGDCKYGHCVCDKNYIGKTCIPIKSRLPYRMFESFEGGIFPSHWSKITGGGIGFGCGALLPYAHGKTLYFNDCGIRQAITAEFNLQTASKIIFVLQIGCNAQTHNCNVQLGDGPDFRGVLLQYSHNKGADWKLLARHDPEKFLKPKRMAYDIPNDGKKVGVQFRWWQPVHDGRGFDQWAIDHIEIVRSRNHYNKKHRRG